MDSKLYQLFGVRTSLYTGKARSYLNKQSIDFIEILSGDPRTKQRVTDVLGQLILPTLISPDGDIVQDSTDIIEYLEAKGEAQYSAYPSSPRQLAVALLLNVYGMEGLLRPAMHYRWGFDDENLEYLLSEFAAMMTPLIALDQREMIAGKMMDRMRGAGEAFGVEKDTMPLIEDMYLELLEILNRHFESNPYLLGGLPSWADYGLMGPLYAHLSRDPAPSSLMKKHAPDVWRWTERMNDRGLRYQDHPQMGPNFHADDEIPETLKALLRFAAVDLVPETLMVVEYTNAWLDKNSDVDKGTPFARGLGMGSFECRGQKISALVQPLRLHLLQKLQDAVDSMNENDRLSVRALFSEVGLEPLLDARANRRTERRDNQGVWGDKIS